MSMSITWAGLMVQCTQHFDGGYDSFSHTDLIGVWGLWVENEKERRERGLEGPLDRR